MVNVEFSHVVKIWYIICIEFKASHLIIRVPSPLDTKIFLLQDRTYIVSTFGKIKKVT